MNNEKSNMSNMNLNQIDRNIPMGENHLQVYQNPGWEGVTDTRISLDENYKTVYNL